MAGPRSRADAGRNTAAVLAAADSLLAESGRTRELTMTEVASRAGVGKGTAMRAFGSKADLLRAVLAARSSTLVEALEAESVDDPVERLVRDLDALAGFKVANRGLALALETLSADSPYSGATYDRWHAHIAGLLRRTGADQSEFRAHVLLAAVRADLVNHLLGPGGWSEDRIRAAVREVVHALTGDSTGPGGPRS